MHSGIEYPKPKSKLSIILDVIAWMVVLLVCLAFLLTLGIFLYYMYIDTYGRIVLHLLIGISIFAWAANRLINKY